MQAPASFALIGAFIGTVALALALSVTIGAPILAVPFFIVGFGAFLVWRGKQRADVPGSGTYAAARERVPDTEDTAGDPAGDSGAGEATRSGSSARHRADVPRV